MPCAHQVPQAPGPWSCQNALDRSDLHMPPLNWAANTSLAYEMIGFESLLALPGAVCRMYGTGPLRFPATGSS